MKKFLAALLRYLAVTCALACALLGGIAWLVRVDATEGAPTRDVPIPPRIADSIERKKTFVPPPPPEAPPAPAIPMHQANVALTRPNTARPVIRELKSPSPPRKATARAKKQAPVPETKVTVAPSYPEIPGRPENLSGL